MKTAFLSALLYLALSTALPAASTSDEIEHLLDFVASSGCIFKRNGSEYESQEARAHIQRKYDHLKDRIDSAESFIRYAASKSSMSGRKYHATCQGKTITSENWLTTELKRYRLQTS